MNDYEEEVGKNDRTDYRWLWQGDFDIIYYADHGSSHYLALRKV